MAGEPKRYRILAVDDDPDALDVLQQALEESYEVFAAQSGAEALEGGAAATPPSS